MNTYIDPHLVNGTTHRMVSMPSSHKAVQPATAEKEFGVLLSATADDRSMTKHTSLANGASGDMTLVAAQQNQEAEIQRAKSGNDALQLARMVMHFF